MARCVGDMNREPIDRGKYLDDAQLRTFLGIIHDRKRKTARRDGVLFLILATVGMRPRELARLTLEDVTLGTEPQLRLRRLKSRKVQGRLDDVPIGAKLGRILRRWIAYRGPGRGPLFPSQQGGELTVRALERLFRRYADAAGIPSEARLYALRHTAARRMLEATGDLRTVQVMLGHASIRTTEIYAHVTMERRRQAADSVLTGL
jgi:integrase/recombinase XerC